MCDSSSRSQDAVVNLYSIRELNVTGITFIDCGSMMLTTLDNVHLKNVSFIDGGQTSIRAVGKFQMNNVSCINCAQWSISSTSYIIVKDSRFHRSRYIRYELLQFNGGISVNITRSSFSGCRHTDIHAVKFGGQMMAINESHFYDNLGGAISTSGNSYISGCTFSKNSKVNGGAAVHAYSTSLVVHKCNFSNNTAGFLNDYASYRGSAIYVQSGSVTIIQSYFKSNRVNYGGGGAISIANGDFIAVINSSFTLNSAVSRGGAVYTTGRTFLTVNNSIFTSNNASYQGGAIYSTSSTLIVQSTFESNAADSVGGAVHVTSNHSTISVKESEFIHNKVSRGSGGAIACTGQNNTILLSESTFNSNSAISCGVLDFDGMGNKVSVTTSVFGSNTATGKVIGGGVACIRNASLLVLNDSFTENTAELDAGVFYLDECTVSIEGCIYDYNSAAHRGGVIFTNVYPTLYDIKRSSFSHNAAGHSGGVIYVGRQNSKVTVQESIFSHNSGNERGGVIAIIGSTLNINETNFYKNMANLGDDISACNCEVLLSAEEFIVRPDPKYTFCTLFDGNVDYFNITIELDIHKDRVTTTEQKFEVSTTVTASDSTASSSDYFTDSPSSTAVPATESDSTVSSSEYFTYSQSDPASSQVEHTASYESTTTHSQVQATTMKIEVPFDVNPHLDVKVLELEKKLHETSIIVYILLMLFLTALIITIIIILIAIVKYYGHKQEQKASLEFKGPPSWKECSINSSAVEMKHMPIK